MGWTVTETVHRILGEELERLESPSLRLEKMLLMQKGKDYKDKQIDAVVKCHEEHASVPAIGFADIPSARRFVMRLADRLIVNHAGGILENTGLCLHRHFGCPYIPGSALKGVARHYAWTIWRESNDENEKQNIALKIALTFGFPTADIIPSKKNKQEREDEKAYLDNYLREKRPDMFAKQAFLKTFSGTVCFLPAFPVNTRDNPPRLTRDITTSHHSQYYQNKQEKAFDCEQPNVLPFPAVEEGTSFEFTVKPASRVNGCSDLIKNEWPDSTDPLEFAETCLREALAENGVGAKTAAGYGWFEEDKEVEERIEKQRQKALEKEYERRRREEERRRKQERLAAMSPIDRRAEELGAMSDNDFKGYLKEIENQSDEEKQAVLKAVKQHKKHIWLADKKGKQKAAKRAEIIRKLAEQYGEKLP